MKRNQTLISTLSYRTLEAKAHKAAAVAEIKARQQKTDKPKSRSRNSRKPIELEINAIFKALKNNLSDNSVVTMERTGKDMMWSAKICVYPKNDFLRQNEEEKSYKKAMEDRYNREVLDKPFKAHPTEVYTLYAGTFFSDKLGSVAIYGNNPYTMLNRISKSGNMWGYPIKEARIEIGRRPYLYVVFRP